MSPTRNTRHFDIPTRLKLDWACRMRSAHLILPKFETDHLLNYEWGVSGVPRLGARPEDDLSKSDLGVI